MKTCPGKLGPLKHACMVPLMYMVITITCSHTSGMQTGHMTYGVFALASEVTTEVCRS